MLELNIKMKKTNFDLLRLINITTKMFINRKIDPQNYPNLSRSSENVWLKITELYYGVVCEKKALLIYTWYRRNTDNYAKLVEHKIKNEKIGFKKESEKNFFKTIFLEFEHEEFESFKRSGKKRMRLLTDFEEVLNNKLQGLDIKCYFRCNHNWFKSNFHSKDSKGNWTGLYKCIEPNCSNYIRALIESFLTDKIIIKILFFNSFEHDKIQKQLRITGDERESLALRLKSEGVLNIYNTIQMKSSYENKSTSIKLKTLQKIKNEFENRFRLSRDFIFDLKATKVLSDNLGISTNSEFKGYVHNICLDPYGFLLMSDIQILIWNKIKISCPVWFFDATGSVHKEIYQQNMPLLYSIVIHDIEQKQILPLAEFVTVDQSAKSISCYLHFIDYNLKENKNKTNFSIAPIVVTDFSWALINSVTDVFNNMSVKDYLNWCFNEIFPNKNNNGKNFNLNTRIYLCSTHFLKLLVKKVKKLEFEPNIKIFFIFCFTMLQNSITIVQFENYLLNIFNIFMNPRKDKSVVYSILEIRKEIVNRNLNYFDFDTLEEVDKSKHYSNSNYFIDKDNLSNETVETLKKSSPFTGYFNLVLKEYESKIKINESKGDEENIFYSPKLFALINDQLYLVPIWTGIMIEDFRKKNLIDLSKCFKTRLSNNPVENYFGILKNRILSKRKVYPSEFISLNFLRIKSKFFEFYMDCQPIRKENQNQILKTKEKWSKKKKRKKKEFVMKLNH